MKIKYLKTTSFIFYSWNCSSCWKLLLFLLPLFLFSVNPSLSGWYLNVMCSIKISSELCLSPHLLFVHMLLHTYFSFICYLVLKKWFHNCIISFICFHQLTFLLPPPPLSMTLKWWWGTCHFNCGVKNKFSKTQIGFYCV